MREIRLSGSEGGGTLVLPTPISAWQSQSTRLVTWLGHSFVSLFEDFVEETREAEAAFQ